MTEMMMFLLSLGALALLARYAKTVGRSAGRPACRGAVVSLAIAATLR